MKDLDDVDQPTWWPKDLPFDNSLVLHSTKKGVSFSLSLTKTKNIDPTLYNMIIGLSIKIEKDHFNSQLLHSSSPFVLWPL